MSTEVGNKFILLVYLPYCAESRKSQAVAAMRADCAGHDFQQEDSVRQGVPVGPSQGNTGPARCVRRGKALCCVLVYDLFGFSGHCAVSHSW